jgi:hypothetical protein
VNGEDFEKGAQALRDHGATWPAAGYEFRKQYVVLQSIEKHAEPCDRPGDKGVGSYLDIEPGRRIRGPARTRQVRVPAPGPAGLLLAAQAEKTCHTSTVSGLIIALRGEVGKRIGGRGHVLE